ncbi:protocatechuate 3,4-dioxygenase subunit alpha [Bradyrhizobium lablabi]|uniref:protocatechuate 3,4-dioxygenase subunit alpha n=1 Tax=Bradyrhizobium lablabi TaxID=722472 RepID=UPI001BAA107D|nr:protocatechuate 3,4-dioxygenase subunit alpha [Bradyrhizobium lablabi]
MSTQLYLPETPSQTAGPYVHIGLIPNQAGFDIFKNNFGGDIAGPHVAGERIVVEGRIYDASGQPAKDVLVETWQANAAGRYNHPADRQDKSLDPDFRGWARAGTDFETGLYRILTIKPGPVVGRRGRKTMAPHINFWIAARGINIGLATRMYFPDETAANAEDPVLNIIEQPERRRTLIAWRSERAGQAVYTFDIFLQGDRETVFFDV